MIRHEKNINLQLLVVFFNKKIKLFKSILLNKSFIMLMILEKNIKLIMHNLLKIISHYYYYYHHHHHCYEIIIFINGSLKQD